MNDDYFDVAAYADPARYLAVSPISHVSKVKTPTLILHGEKDERVAPQQAWELYRGLRWAGVECELVTYPREPHGIAERAHQVDLTHRVLDWFERHLKESGV
jgi:dipeptidyl aminopeptidase/acylaminoacyl peptidase